MSEVLRIHEAYQKRKLAFSEQRWSHLNPDALYMYQSRERKILEIIRQRGLLPLDSKKILDIGSSKGETLYDFTRYGVQAKNCYGLDLRAEPIRLARRAHPEMHFICQNAEKLHYKSGFFDLVLCFTVFSSIRDVSMKQNIIREMLRVLKPGGYILLYDFFIKNPANLDVQPVKPKELKLFFKGHELFFKKVTLAPPLVRMFAPLSYILCMILEKITILRTHYLCLVRKI